MHFNTFTCIEEHTSDEMSGLFPRTCESLGSHTRSQKRQSEKYWRIRRAEPAAEGEAMLVPVEYIQAISTRNKYIRTTVIIDRLNNSML
jgi:hypothetical protein